MAHYENQYSAGQVLQTDEYGNPVRQTDEYGNPVYHTGGTMGDYGTTGAGTYACTTGGTMGDYGTTGTYAGGGAATTGLVSHGDQRQHEHGTLGGMLHRSGSSSSSSSEDDGQGGRRKKKGIKEKIKEKLPGGHKDDQTYPAGATPTGYGIGGEHHQNHEKKGIMDKIKEKLPGHHGTGHH